MQHLQSCGGILHFLVAFQGQDPALEHETSGAGLRSTKKKEDLEEFGAKNNLLEELNGSSSLCRWIKWSMFWVKTLHLERGRRSKVVGGKRKRGKVRQKQ